LRFRNVDFELNDTAGTETCFVLGIRKSGSSIFNNICSALASFNDVKFVDVGGAMFEAGQSEADWADDPDIEHLLLPGNLYGGFRSFPGALGRTETFRQSPKVLLVRDPRDVLVSEYFSNAFSHSMPDAGDAREQLDAERRKALSTDISLYIMGRIQPLKQTIQPFVSELKGVRTKVFRYEDVIFEKEQLMRDVCEHFGWRVSEQHIENIMKWADVRPSAEQPNAFIRKVTPGDYKEKMPEEIQRKVKAEMPEFFEKFGYS